MSLDDWNYAREGEREVWRRTVGEAHLMVSVIDVGGPLVTWMFAVGPASISGGARSVEAGASEAMRALHRWLERAVESKPPLEELPAVDWKVPF